MVLQFQHVVVCLHHFSVVILRSLVLHSVLLAKRQSLVNRGQSLVIAIDQREKSEERGVRSCQVCSGSAESAWNWRLRTSMSRAPSHRRCWAPLGARWSIRPMFHPIRGAFQQSRASASPQASPRAPAKQKSLFRSACGSVARLFTRDSFSKMPYVPHCSGEPSPIDLHIAFRSKQPRPSLTPRIHLQRVRYRHHRSPPVQAGEIASCCQHKSEEGSGKAWPALGRHPSNFTCILSTE